MEENSKHLTIKELAEDDRPREKLRSLGRQALSDAELLAIILGGGTSTETALQIARRMLSEHGNSISRLAKLSIAELTKYRGVGQVRAIGISAAFELGRRRRESGQFDRPKISSSASAYQILQKRLSDLPHEEFWVLHLNRANLVLKEELISRGGISGTVVDVRLICRSAIENGSSALVIAHNHPSGQVLPSEQDKAITRKLKEGLKILDIALLDHLIIGDQKFCSFADEGLL